MKELQFACLITLLEKVDHQDLSWKSNSKLYGIAAQNYIDAKEANKDPAKSIQCMFLFIENIDNQDISTAMKMFLNVAIRKADVELVEGLLRKACNPNTPYQQGHYSGIVAAIALGKNAIVEAMYKAGKIDFNMCHQEIQGRTIVNECPLLAYAILDANKTLVEFMMKNGADVSKKVVLNSGRQLSLVSMIDLVLKSEPFLAYQHQRSGVTCEDYKQQQLDLRKLLMDAGCKQYISQKPSLRAINMRD